MGGVVLSRAWVGPPVDEQKGGHMGMEVRATYKKCFCIYPIGCRAFIKSTPLQTIYISLLFCPHTEITGVVVPAFYSLEP